MLVFVVQVARIGLFLHTPFPPSEVFRALPHREDLLRGMLGADQVQYVLLWLELQTYLRDVCFAILPLGSDAVMSGNSDLKPYLRCVVAGGDGRLRWG